MNSVLEKILSTRRADVARLDANVLREQAERVRRSRSSHQLRFALQQRNGVKIIAEFKRASPSLGNIRQHAEVSDLVSVYQQAGACAVSVLTEPAFFCGSLTDLCEARAVTTLPILRKDFIICESQIDEAAAAGADAVLLITAVLSDSELHRLRVRAEDELGLDALVEVHTAEEMQRATRCGATLIGVNNRDLRTFETSLEISKQLSAVAPAGAILVSESGIGRADDIARLERWGYNAFLIGESLMRSNDPALLIRSLRRRRVYLKVCGITNIRDALVCAEAGVQMIGLNFWPDSARWVSPNIGREILSAVRPLFPNVKFVGIFVDQHHEFVQNTIDALTLDAVQLHGEETPEYLLKLRAPFVIKALRVGAQFSPASVERYDCDAILLDSHASHGRGGTGEAFNWLVASAVKPYAKRLILAGGLTAENVRSAIDTVGPFAIDVCSATEQTPGHKDPEALRRFVEAAVL